MAEPSATISGRACGILLHPTSLPGPGIGDLGEPAERFVDWLRTAGQSLWQVLPLVAVDDGGSPYNGLSAFAGNPLLLSAARLADEGLLGPDDPAPPPLPEDRVDFPAVAAWKGELLRRAHLAFDAARAPRLREAFAAYREANAGWLADYALFRALRDREGGRAWTEWPEPLRRRDPAALRAAGGELAPVVERHAFGQFLFDRQWEAVRARANDAGIRVIGDVPIFVAHDSADVWANPHLFELDEAGRPTVVAGVPPDYFSETGQRWGNPLYRWEAMARDGYAWWRERFRRTLEMVDVARVDHFRGFESYWEIPAGEPTALKGRWLPGPGRRLFDALQESLGRLPLIAEDLGIITREVEALRDDLGLPGMRVLQFAFGSDDAGNPHLPENYVPNAVAYTGTHDNDTAVGWWAGGATPREREALRARAPGVDRSVSWTMVEVVLQSRADWAVIPLQDVLALGSDARMNVPGASEGNWSWRFREDDLLPALAERLAERVRASGRGRPGLATEEADDGR
jgi:4-alpha-glucanotransferase